MKVTWIGHASFLVEATAEAPSKENATENKANGTIEGDTEERRGVRILLDPVFCEKMGPLGLVGPKRFSPPPCRLEDMPEVDVVCISHNHYDHLDVDAVKQLYFDKRRSKPLHFFCGLGTKSWFASCGVREEDVSELDWWDEVEVRVQNVGRVKLACTPSQHLSRRSAWDDCQMLWCSWVIEELGDGTPPNRNRKLFFSGDTGYRTVTDDDIATGKDESTLPHCPAFGEIGNRYGPFDLALLPIGCYTPRTFMSSVHCAPEDSIEIHKDIKSKRSLGMHYGTVRGGLSAQYEDVREPPRRWREFCEKEGLKWGEEIFLCDIGETVVVD
jgi:N-acyl-phosphatidylethanolamine-hydrolysing phospholipase D